MTKRKFQEEDSELYPIKKIKTSVEIYNTKKRKHDDSEPLSQPLKKCKIDFILHDENMSEYIKKRRDMLIYM